MSWFYRKLAGWLSSRDKAGNIRMPGGSIGIAMVEPDGSQVGVIAQGDSIVLYYGKDAVTGLSLTPTSMLRVAWFSIWTWWVCSTWFGIRTRIWQWAVMRIPPRKLEPTELVISVPHTAFDRDRVAGEMARSIGRKREQSVRVGA